MKRLVAFAVVAATFCVAAVTFAATQGNTALVHGSLQATLSHVALKPCSGGFSATADIRLNVSSPDARLRGVMRLKLTETANRSDDAYVAATGGFFDSRTNARKGTATLTAVDKGNDLNGIYVIRLSRGGGMIVGNTSSHQDTPATAHGEIGSDAPLRPSNTAVIVTNHC